MNDLRYIPEKHACVHVVVINNFQPEMCKLTLPNLKAYADRIGADFNIIDKAVFDGFPPVFEQFQVYKMGKPYKYNMVINADFILHTDVPDFTKYFSLNSVGYLGSLDVGYCFKPNNYFKKDGRNRGMSDALVVSTYLTHDVWTPCSYSYEELKGECLLSELQIGELWLSINLARFGIPFIPLFTKSCKIYHAGVSSYKVEKPEELIKYNLKLWEMLGG